MLTHSKLIFAFKNYNITKELKLLNFFGTLLTLKKIISSFCRNTLTFQTKEYKPEEQLVASLSGTL